MPRYTFLVFHMYFRDALWVQGELDSSWVFILLKVIFSFFSLLVVTSRRCGRGTSFFLFLAPFVEETVIGGFQIFNFYLVIVHSHGCQSTCHLLLKCTGSNGDIPVCTAKPEAHFFQTSQSQTNNYLCPPKKVSPHILFTQKAHMNDKESLTD